MLSDFLDQTITVQRKTLTVDAQLSRQATWANHLSLAAQVSDPSGEEVEHWSKEGSTVNIKIVVSGEPDITTEDRVLFDGKTVNIAVVLPAHHLGRHTKIIGWTENE